MFSFSFRHHKIPRSIEVDREQNHRLENIPQRKHWRQKVDMDGISKQDMFLRPWCETQYNSSVKNTKTGTSRTWLLQPRLRDLCERHGDGRSQEPTEQRVCCGELHPWRSLSNVTTWTRTTTIDLLMWKVVGLSLVHCVFRSWVLCPCTACSLILGHCINH